MRREGDGEIWGYSDDDPAADALSTRSRASGGHTTKGKRRKASLNSKASISRTRTLLGRAVLLEAGAAIILFGSLIQQPGLVEYGARALQELHLRGYEIPTAADPVRAYPAATSEDFSSSHAGGWRPGVISLRQHPQGSAGIETYLRHELMHEACFRTCKGKLQLWAEEAAAISFAMESSGRPVDEGLPGDSASAAALGEGAGGGGGFAGNSCEDQVSTRELEHLRQRVRIGAALSPADYRVLALLVGCHGWPSKPCARSDAIERLLQHPPPRKETGFSYILASLLSGRIFESHGDLSSRHPPGSLLKIPYAAALQDVSPEALGKELAASDTEKLLARRECLDLERFRFLISPVKDAVLARGIPLGEIEGKTERFWRQYVGERGDDGDFPLEASLLELTRMLRASLLYRPACFSGLSQNGFLEGSTLYQEPADIKKILKKLRAMAKTGTVADERGSPLRGHLMIAWPVEDPVFLAVFRSVGVNGAANLRRASKLLERWATEHAIPSEGKVRVRLLTLAPRSFWEVFDECPAFEREAAGGWKVRVSTCGCFRIIADARGSRSERLVSGVLSTSRDGQAVVLETDPETYADGVLAAEAEGLRGEAGKALRAVVVWNGTHGRTRHRDSSSLCDTTHCMVFQGRLPEAGEAQGRPSDRTLLNLLDRLAAKRKADWFPFSKGGSEPWVKEIPVSSLLRSLNEPSLLDVRRERTRKGDIVIHLMYAEDEEVVPCEVFRNRLKLPSCPEVISHDDAQGSWGFSGLGEGHGEGLSVTRARALAEAGHSAPEILSDAYR